jgi:acyl carrier protein
VPREVAGELYIGGLAPARGYLDRPGLTAERFWPDPFSAVPGARMYRTSDLARWRQDGNLQFLGRADQQVKVRGFRVEPGEIEGALASHPWVRQCVVVAHDTGQGDVRLVAYITTAEDTELNVEVLRNFLSHELPAYMIPSAFMRLDALPLTPSGKVDRQALPALVTPGAADYVAPTNPVEEKLAEIWAALLDREQVSIHDDFFALGGHSLTAMRLATRVEEAFGIEFELRLLFEASTLSELAQVIFSCQLEQLSDENLSDMLRAIEDEQ